MSENTNTLDSNSAGGDIAGGDIDKSVTIQLPSENKSTLRKIVEKLKEEHLYDPDFNKYISDLIHYTNSIHPNEQRNLQDKLFEAGRTDELYEAEELKEKFTKLLVKNSLSEQAQKAYVHILSKIKLDYDHKVKPLLKINASLVDVEKMVREIIMNIYEDLAGTVLEHNTRDIKGMLYYLTGNCHIQWKY